VAVQVVAGGVVPERCDALVTSRAGLGLAALSADCALIVLADPHAGVVGVAHCGRPGLVEGVVGTAVAALRRLGAMHIQAAVGPTICANCYPLPREMAAAVAAAVPAAAVRPTSGPAWSPNSSRRASYRPPWWAAARARTWTCSPIVAMARPGGWRPSGG
jgi:copper oxidase (laccase) domain-containing protein